MIVTTPTFEKTLADLNDAQRYAVENIHGPMMVLAGPGTGKTHMLAARIGNILLHEQVEPRNILCLTFTNAGVKAMRDRLVKFIGAAGSRVAVHTFHDFARDVIEEFPALFDSLAWEPMDDLDRHRLINHMIDGLPPKHLLRGPSYEPYASAKDLMWLFDKMAQESWTVDKVVGYANHHVESLPNLEEYVYKTNRKGRWQKGDLKPSAVEQEARMERLIAAAKLQPVYAALKREQALYDYSDQISWLYEALSEHLSLRQQLQERYQYILVDEYQDTNGIQSEIVAMLAEDERPNLFIVGDDDQSIYGFQGARIVNLLKLGQRYDGLQASQLTNNYRSHRAILEAARHLIDFNQTRLTEIQGQQLDKTLVESHPRWAQAPEAASASAKTRSAPPDGQTLFDSLFGDGTGQAREDDPERPRPRVRLYPTELAQAHYVARQLGAWIEEGVDPNEIGVIYRNHAQADRLIECLENLDVPYRLEKSINVLQQPLILRLRATLSFVAGLRSDRQTVEAHAREFMLSPAIGLTMTELDAINNFRFLASRRVPGWRYLLLHPEAMEGDEVPFDNPERFRVAADLINKLGALVDRYPLGTLVQQVAQQTGLLREALGGDDKQLALECIDALVRDANARVRKDPGLTLEGLCETWDEMDAYDLAMRLNKQADTRAAVTLMTAHSAKGLEFECVVMYDVNSAKWESSRKSHTGFTLPPELSFEFDKQDERDEENRRLLYVAITRAKRELIMSFAEESQTGRGLSIATNVEVLVQEGLVEQEEPDISDDELYGALAQVHARPLAAVAPLLSPSVAKAKWLDQEMSLGALTQFDRCKVGFYYQYVSNAPRTTRSQDRYRNAVHATIQEFYGNALKPEDQAFQSEEELIALFTHHLNRERGGIKTEELERYQAEGEETLRAWYHSEEDPFRFNVLLERSFSMELPSGVRVRGRIDRVDIDPSTTLGIPVDYKLGAPREINMGKYRTGEPKCLEDRNWRQLAYYAILLRDGLNKGVLPRRGKIVNLGPKGTVVQEVELDPEYVALFEQQLHDTYHAIVDCEDYSGCHEDPEKTDRDRDNCAWCKFHYLKRNGVELVSEEVEVLDE